MEGNLSREASPIKPAVNYPVLTLFDCRVIYLRSSPLIVLAVALVTTAELLTRRRRLAFLPLIRWPPPVCLRLTLPVAVIFTLLLNPLWVFCLGIWLIPLKSLSEILHPKAALSGCVLAPKKSKSCFLLYLAPSVKTASADSPKNLSMLVQ
jgi:hypothetical protein